MADSQLAITSKILVEYICSGAAGRDRIVNSLAFPEEFKTYLLWYEEYKSALATYFSSQDFESSFSALKQALQSRPAQTEQAEQKIQKSLHAIELTSKIEVFQLCPEAQFYLASPEVKFLEIEGLRVRVDASNISQVARPDQNRVGLIYPYLKATKKLGDNALAYHGVLLHWTAENALEKYGTADTNLCLVADIFGGRTVKAPSSYKKIRQEIAANCREIVERVNARLAAPVPAKKANPGNQIAS